MQAPLLLVCDDAPDTAEVLRAVYAPRGVAVQRLRSTQSVPESPQAASMVLVLNAGERDEWRTGPWRQAPRVLIGRAAKAAASPGLAPSRDGECMLDSPFQFRDLIGAIDRLLAQPAA